VRLAIKILLAAAFAFARVAVAAPLFVPVCFDSDQQSSAKEPPISGQSSESKPSETKLENAEESKSDEAAPDGDEEPKPQEEAASQRTQLNLLGQTDQKSGEARRNENVQFNLIDNNAQKELMQRVGMTATFVQEFSAEKNYFGTEFGNAPVNVILLTPKNKQPWRGQLGWAHLNSALSARAFFQVGSVQPARENSFDVQASGQVWKGASLSLDAAMTRIRGVVNGNILAPLPSERTPLTNDPILANIVQRMLDSYPQLPPNRPDIDPRMINLNAAQKVDTENTNGRLDQRWRERNQLIATHTFITQRVDAFQFVKGQNPDTTARTHRAGLQYHRTISPTTVLALGFRADRTVTRIVPEPGSFPAALYPSQALTAINANNSVPINRSLNLFRTSGQMRKTTGRGEWNFGFELNRRHLNGTESDAHLPAISYGNTRDSEGRVIDAITNFRRGTPINYFQAIGFIHRGFRNWDNWLYAGGKRRLSNSLTVNGGLGYRPSTRPYEVNGLNTLPYYGDANNFGPFLGLAYRLPNSWGVLRSAYAIHYGEIFPVTFQQVRFNLPLNRKLVIQNPDLRNPLNATSSGKPVQYDYSDDLVAPYAQQYNFSWETNLSKDLVWQTGYIGSRQLKLLYHLYTNRGLINGTNLTLNNVDARRWNQDAGEIRRVTNMARGYFDAFRTALTVRQWRGLGGEVAYWFSKSLDTGADYAGTAQDQDSFRARGQSEFTVFEEMKGRSRYDQPHALVMRGNYALPNWTPRWRSKLGQWSLNGVVLLKSGTPFNVTTGSDAPGFGNVDGMSGDRPNILAPEILGATVGNPDDARSILRRDRFSFIRTGDPRGNLGRNAFRRGAIRNVNSSLNIAWRLPAEKALTLRVDSNNLTNTPQFAEPGFALTDPNFGVITNTLNDGRSFRFTLRLAF
jgi:hypothetical protein